MRRFVALAASVALGATFVAAQGSSKTVPELTKMANDFAALVNAGHAAKVAGLYTADATFMPPNEPAVRGTAAIQGWFQKQMDQGVLNLQLTPTESRISGDLAFESGTFSFGLTPKTGQPVSDKGKYVIVLRKDGAAWKISHDIFNSDLPPPPPAK